MTSLTKERGKVLLIENLASDFYGARLPLAKFLMNQGWDVYAMIPSSSEYTLKIQQERVNVIEYNLNRKNKGLFQLYDLLKSYNKILKDNKFDVVHSFRFQPNLLNALSGIGKSHQKILHVTGLGIAFSNHSVKYIFYKIISQIFFFIKLILADVLIVQNSDDARDIWACKIFIKKVRLINGSGIDINKFSPELFDKKIIRQSFGISENQKLFICVTRLIWEKGIKELVEAFTNVHNKNREIILFIVGGPDYDNPRHVTDSFISSNNSIDNGIIFLGRRIDIPELLAASDIFIFPSYYREGIPRGLLEALSMGLPIITTDMPGCKMTISDGSNGILIKSRSVDQLEDSISQILHSDIEELGKRSRQLVVEKFQDKIIFQKILSLYNLKS